VQLPDPPAMARRYPHQLSGGQQQRVSIATALACDPDLLVLDEPTTGLDVTTEARILDLVASLRERSGAGILYITHNLGVVGRLGSHPLRPRRPAASSATGSPPRPPERRRPIGRTRPGLPRPDGSSRPSRSPTATGAPAMAGRGRGASRRSTASRSRWRAA